MQSWKKLLSYHPVDFVNEKLQITKGKLPSDLKGTLYRNTAAIFQRKNGYPGHLFDGDGAILKVEFTGNEVIGSYKQIQTQEYIREQQVDEFIYAGLGRPYSGNFFTKIFNSLNFKNAANTSVLPLKNGDLLALWEGGLPTALNKQNLNIIGQVDGGNLKKGDAFSAHPKIDSKTGLIYNVGTTTGMNSTINVYEMDQSGKILRRGEVAMDGRRFMIHDFVLAGDYLVVLVYGLFISDLYKVLLGNKALGQNVIDDPTKGIQVVIFDRRKNLQCISNKINYLHFNAFHYSNGYVDQNGNIVTQLITYPDEKFYNSLSINNLMQQDQNFNMISAYERLIINPQTADIIQREKISDDIIEFPVVHDDDVGVQQQITYGNIAKNSNDWFNGVIKINEENYNKSLKRFYDNGQYISEALFVQNNKQEKGKGWLLLILFDGNSNKNFVEILDSESLETVCQLILPQLVSLSFHGRFEYNL